MSAGMRLSMSYLRVNMFSYSASTQPTTVSRKSGQDSKILKDLWNILHEFMNVKQEIDTFHG